MSVQVFPVLPGRAWSVIRNPTFATRKPVAVYGKETSIADMPYPKQQYTLVHNVLRQGSNLIAAGDNWTEYGILRGFYLNRLAGADSFLFNDDKDNTNTAQPIQNTATGLPTGDGVTRTFQLIASNSGFSQPCYAPNVVSHAYVNGVDPTGWSFGAWESAAPGIITFASAPGNGLAVTADFTYYYPCRFDTDQCEFEQFDSVRFRVKKLTFTSLV